ncbi:MAG: hypothetical protein IJ640_09305 [Prevotella sp.]|nr:hypothetical protein [Prevotella sp.]
MLEIKRIDGTRIIQMDVPEGSLVHRELMGEHYVKIPFSTEEPVYFHLGDWCHIEGFGRFELTDLYSPKYNTETGGYDYDLKLDAYYIKWKNKICKYVPESNASETSFHLTAIIDVHLGVITNTINAIGAKDSNFRFEGSPFRFELRNFDADKAEAAKYKHYDNTDIISALNDLASIYDCEWWVDDDCICFGRLELDGEAVDFVIDENVSEVSSSESKDEYANRIYAFGSERNLPPDYRKDNSADITLNGVVQKRLMLPLKECPFGYIQDGNLSETEAVEAVIIDDDIYPKVKCIVDKVETYTGTVEDAETGESVTQTFYRVYDKSGFKFSSDFILEGETLHILFQSGKMNGMDFECIYDDTKKYYEVVANEDYGRTLPDTSLHPEEDEEFVIYNWDSTKIGNTGLIEAAEEELRKAIAAKLAKMKIAPNTYTCKMMSDVYEEEMRTSDNTYTHYDMGQRVKLDHPVYFEDGRSSRIIGYDIKLDIPYDEPQYIVGESTAYSRTADMQSQIDALTFNGVSYQSKGSGGSGVYIITSTSQTPASDSNVYSAKRSDQQFLRKDIADTARGRITHLQQSQHNQGIQLGEQFVGGLVGIGGKFDGKGNGELRSLKLWEWLEVPELRFNKVSIYTGIRWDTFGGGIIETITPDPTGAQTGRGTLKLDDGEFGAIDVGDLCMGIWHDERIYVEDDGTLDDLHEDYTIVKNEDENTDDNKGNFTFAGFKTVYFQITGVSGASNNEFTYVLRSDLDGGNGIHPFDGMHFAGRGNISNAERQAFTYTTTQYSLSLTGVNTWEFQPSNYNEIRGNLEGFTMPAMNSQGQPYTKVFHGHGQVFGNAYIFGQIDTFERIAYRMEINQSLNGSLAPNETETVTCTIFDGYNVDVTSQFTLFSVTRNTGDSASDLYWNSRHTNVGNPFQISFSDLGIDGIHKLLATFHVEATDEASDITANALLDYTS